MSKKIIIIVLFSMFNAASCLGMKIEQLLNHSSSDSLSNPDSLSNVVSVREEINNSLQQRQVEFKGYQQPFNVAHLTIPKGTAIKGRIFFTYCLTCRNKKPFYNCRQKSLLKKSLQGHIKKEHNNTIPVPPILTAHVPVNALLKKEENKIIITDTAQDKSFTITEQFFLTYQNLPITIS